MMKENRTSIKLTKLFKDLFHPTFINLIVK